MYTDPMKNIHAKLEVNAYITVRYEQTVENGWWTGYSRWGSVTAATMPECERLLAEQVKEAING